MKEQLKKNALFIILVIFMSSIIWAGNYDSKRTLQRQRNKTRIMMNEGREETRIMLYETTMKALKNYEAEMVNKIKDRLLKDLIREKE